MKIYRARDGKLLGVCKGFAQAMDWPVRLVRLGYILFTVFTGIWPGVGIYLIAGFLLEPEPVLPFRNPQESDFYSRYRASKKSALHELNDRMSAIDQRLRRMEDKVTRPGFDWEARLRP